MICSGDTPFWLETLDYFLVEVSTWYLHVLKTATREAIECNRNFPVAVSNVFFFCVRCDDRAKSSGRWLLGSPPSAVARQLASRAWCPLQCLLAKTVGVLSPGVGRSEECAQEFAPQSCIHSGLNQQDLIYSLFRYFLSPQ